MRGFRFLPLVVVTVAMAVAVGAAVAVTVARQGMHTTLAESPGRVGGTVAIILVAALATLPLVTLLVYLRRHPLPIWRPVVGLDRRRLRFGLGALLVALPGVPFLFGGLHGLQLGDSARTAMIAVRGMAVIGFVGYALMLHRFVRWLDGRLLRQTS